MAIWKASRSDSRIAAGSMRALKPPRLVSLALRAKCLMVDMTCWPCMPRYAARHHPCEQRIFPEILEIAPRTGVTSEICRAAEQHVEALGVGFGEDRFA